jgi:serine/threonine protein kinase
MDQNPPEETPGSGGTGSLSEPGARARPQELDYELIRLIGRGGYGDVWLVRDQAGNYFACKVVYRESFQSNRPYEREYEGIQKFEPVSRSSESQVKILHVGRRDEAGYFYYIMELADDFRGSTIDPGSYVPRTLSSEIERRKKLPVGECIQIGLSLNAALENLHRHGLIHRDIKPANIIFVQGVPKLADIGLVTDMDVTVSYVGTEGFIPPEGPKSAQADIYSLGKVLYEIATGKDRLEFPELPEDFGELPDWETLLELNAVIIKACETKPRKRYATARDFYDDLALLGTGKSVRRNRAARRRMRIVLQFCLALIAASVIGAGVFYFLKFWAGRQQSVAAGALANPLACGL